MDGHPIRLELGDDLRRSRLTVLFRLLLALPHLVWLLAWSFAVAVAAVAGWVIALLTAQLPAGLHRFFSAYVRYAAHVGAYLTIVASPYPGFTGEPGYALDVSLPPAPLRQERWTIALRLLLALPALVLGAVLGAGGGGGGRARGSSKGAGGGVAGVAAICALLGWFASLATGRMPLGLRNLAAYGIGYTAQATAYVLLLTDRYPSADPDAIGPEWALPPHPVTLVLEDDGRRSRVTALFRVLLALPHVVWLTAWTVLALLAGIANGVAALVRGRAADTLHRFLAAYVRYHAHVHAFTFLVANPFPGFVGAAGYPVEPALAPPAEQSRWVTLFRGVLGVPALLVAAGLAGALLAVGLLGWLAALATGRMPTGLRNLGAVAVRYFAQTSAYWLVLTDRYPHASPALRPPADEEPALVLEAAA